MAPEVAWAPQSLFAAHNQAAADRPAVVDSPEAAGTSVMEDMTEFPVADIVGWVPRELDHRILPFPLNGTTGLNANRKDQNSDVVVATLSNR